MSYINLDINTNVAPRHVNGLFSGEIRYLSSESIKIDSVILKITIEAKGKMPSYKKEICVSTIPDSQFHLEKDKEYYLPFTFKLDNNIETYEGENVKILYNCQVRTHVNEKHYSDLDTSFFHNIKALISSDKSIKQNKYFNYKIRDKVLIVSPENLKLNLTPNKAIIALVASLLTLFYLFLIPEITIEYFIFGVVGAIGISFFISTQVLQALLGTLTIKTENEDDQFYCLIDNSGTSSLNKIDILYEIVEVVIDNRGSSTSTYEKAIIESRPQKEVNLKSNNKISFQFPKKRKFHSVSAGNASIVYRLFIDVKTKVGTTLTYKTDFTVKVK